MDADGAAFQPSFTVTLEGRSAIVRGSLNASNVDKASGKFIDVVNFATDNGGRRLSLPLVPFLPSPVIAAV